MTFYETIVIDSLVVEDLEAVAALEQGVVSGWSLAQLGEELRQGHGVQYVTRPVGSDRIIGLLCSRLTDDEAEILKLTVDAQFRRHGVGSRLLNFFLQEMSRSGVRQCFLEMRASNIAARGLYEKNGFVEIGIRKEYYTLPAEHAVLLKKTFCSDNGD